MIKAHLEEISNVIRALRIEPFRDRRGRESYKWVPNKGFVHWWSKKEKEGKDEK